MIPDAAVEAAARAAAKDEDASNWDDEHQYYRNGWLNRMQVALEAAAPHLMAELADDALRSAWDKGYEVGQQGYKDRIAEAWDEGWQKAHATEDPPMAGIFFNPYRQGRSHGDH